MPAHKQELLGFHLGSGAKSLTHCVAATRTWCSCTGVGSVDGGGTGGEDYPVVPVPLHALNHPK